MNKLYILMGKSAAGKDSVYKELTGGGDLPLKTLVPYTTRPPRQGEVHGRDYFFISREEKDALAREGRIIEERTYATIQGPWTYLTADDGQINLEKASYLLIGTPETYLALRTRFGRDRVVGLLIELDPAERLQRAIEREKKQERPDYVELCRRYLADEEDFSEEKLREAGLDRFFDNGGDRGVCAERIRAYLREERKRSGWISE